MIAELLRVLPASTIASTVASRPALSSRISSTNADSLSGNCS